MTAEERQALISNHLDMVSRSVNYAMWRHKLPSEFRDDYQSAAHLGLVEAANSWDPTKGASFRSHAFSRIRGAILDEITNGSEATGHGAVIHEHVDSIASEIPHAERLSLAREEATRVRRLIEELPKAERKLIHDVYLSDMRLGEHAKKENISKSWASRLHGRALALLRNAEHIAPEMEH